MVFREALVEDTDVLVCPQGHLVGVQETGRLGLLPNEVVPPPSWVAGHQLGCEHPLAEEDDGASFLDQTGVLLPQLVKWNDGIPFVPGAPVRQVTDDGIEGMVRQHGHSLNAILHVYDVRS